MRKRKGGNLQISSTMVFFPLYFIMDSGYTNEVSVYKLYLLGVNLSVIGRVLGQAFLRTTSPSRLRRATSPGRGGFGSPRKVNGFARGSPTRGNNDDRRQRRKQGVAVGAAASRMRGPHQGPKQMLGAATRAVARRRRDGEVWLLLLYSRRKHHDSRRFYLHSLNFLVSLCQKRLIFQKTNQPKEDRL